MTGRQPRVFHLITRLIDGGAEAVLVDLVSGMEEYSFTVGHGASVDETRRVELENLGVETRRFPLVRHYNPVTALPAVLSVARYLRREEFDLVHTHSTEAGIIGRFAASLAGVPAVVHTVHGVPFTDDRSWLLNGFVRRCERLAASRTDRILTNADVMAEEYLRRGIGDPDQYTTVPVGVDLDRFTDVDPATDLPGQRPRIVSVGRLAAGKGFDVLLDAVDAMDRTDMSVYIAGDGPKRDALEEAIARKGLDSRVSLLGHREDVPAVLAASDVFALPSYREGTPRSITEAMAAGLPVVATDVAGIPEQVVDGETGYLVPVGNSTILSDRLETVLASSERRLEMGAAGRRRATKFSVDKMIQGVEKTYKEVLFSNR